MFCCKVVHNKKKINEKKKEKKKHLLLTYARNLFVGAMVLSFFDYCDIIWGDRNNKVLMVPSRNCTVRRLRLFSIALYTAHPLWRLSTFGGSTFVFDGAFIGLFIFFKFLNGLLDHNYHFNTGSVVHNYQTPHASDLRLNRLHCSKGQLRYSYFSFKEWNEIPLKPGTVKMFAVLKTLFYNFQYNLSEAHETDFVLLIVFYVF